MTKKNKTKNNVKNQKKKKKIELLKEAVSESTPVTPVVVQEPPAIDFDSNYIKLREAFDKLDANESLECADLLTALLEIESLVRTLIAYTNIKLTRIRQQQLADEGVV